MKVLSLNKKIRVAVILFLILGLSAPFAQIYVPSRFFVSGDAAATIDNIMAAESLFRLGIFSLLFSQVVQIFWALVLYWLLKPVNKNVALLMLVLHLLGIPIAMLNELNYFAVLRLLRADYLAAFTPDQLQAQVSLFLSLHGGVDKIAGIFWGLWLFPFGYLVYKSGFLPRIIGVLLIIGGFGYLIQYPATLLLPNLNTNIIFFTAWGELLLPLWLLIKGVNVEQWEKRALETA